MAFAPLKTGADLMGASHKVLLYAAAGWGKTSQAVNFKRAWGKGFILSGESGLRSIGHEEIDYLPFTTWDGDHDYKTGICSFMGLVRDLHSKEFKDAGYKWIMVDSLTEVSDRLMEHLADKHKGSKNRFELWNDYAIQMIGVLKIIRDLPYHVIMTALVKDSTDDNNVTTYGPMIKGNAVASQLCGIMDHVFAGVKVTKATDPSDPTAKRYVVIDECRGYTAKLRDPYRRFSHPFVETDDVTSILRGISMSQAEFQKVMDARAAAAKTTESEE